MAKNENVVIAVFDDQAAAEQGMNAVRKWDKADTEVKLGAIGTVYKKNGKVKTRVGRKAGKGAGVGAVVGIIAGVLSGGATLIGGAAAGGVLGAITGSFFKRSLHLTKEEILELGEKLDAGQVAVVVTCDENEVEGTSAVLKEAGGAIAAYDVPEEAIDEAAGAMAESGDLDAVAGEEETLVADPTTPEDMRKFSLDLQYIEGIGPVYGGKLNDVGIITPLDLLRRGASRTGRAQIVRETGISGKRILGWVNQVDLYRIKGVAQEYADLLERAGVDTVIELAQRDPGNLHQRMIEVNREKNLVRQTPTLTLVEGWVAQAKDLPRVVTY